MEKMREEFEAWACNYNLKIADRGNYADRHVNNMWKAWQASRAALCVELPVWTLKNGVEHFNYHKADDVKSICEDAGVPYK